MEASVLSIGVDRTEEAGEGVCNASAGESEAEEDVNEADGTPAASPRWRREARRAPSLPVVAVNGEDERTDGGTLAFE